MDGGGVRNSSSSCCCFWPMLLLLTRGDSFSFDKGRGRGGGGGGGGGGVADIDPLFLLSFLLLVEPIEFTCCLLLLLDLLLFKIEKMNKFKPN